MKNVLNLLGANVTKTEEKDEAYRFHVTLEVKEVACPQCGGAKLYAFGTRAGLYMDLPMQGKRVGINLKRQRYRCRDCKATFLQPCSFIHNTYRATDRLVEWIEEQSLKNTFTSLADVVGLDEKSVRNIFGTHAINLESSREFVTPEYMGIDELFLLHKPRCIITNVNHQTVINLLPDRSKPAVINFLEQLDRPAVKCVCVDMWLPYRDAVRKVFPKAAVVVDKFHTVKIANLCVDQVRKDYGSRLAVGKRRGLMRRRHLLLRREDELRGDDLATLKQWKTDCPELGEAYAAKESFFRIYDVKGRKEAEAAYHAWYDSLSLSIRKWFLMLTTAMKNWRNEVFSYFDHPVTNAYTECLNGLVKMTNRQGRGYSFDAIRVKTLLAHGTYKTINDHGKTTFRRTLFPDLTVGDKLAEGYERHNLGVPVTTFIDILERQTNQAFSTQSSK